MSVEDEAEGDGKGDEERTPTVPERVQSDHDQQASSGLQGDSQGALNRLQPSSGEQDAAEPELHGRGLEEHGYRPEPIPEDGGQPPLSGLVLRSGPLPDAAEFAAYEQVLPGSANRIFELTERSQEASIKRDRDEAVAVKWTAVLAAGLPYVALVVAVVLALIGQDVGAVFSAVVAATGAAPRVISAIRGQDGES